MRKRRPQLSLLPLNADRKKPPPERVGGKERGPRRAALTAGPPLIQPALRLMNGDSRGRVPAMCNLYRQRSGPQAILDLSRAIRSDVGNMEPRDIYPDYAAPIVRWEGAERILTAARWGMPSSRKALMDAATKRADKLRAKGKDVDFPKLLEMEPDSGTTNVRNTSSSHWKPWLKPENRCLVPFTAFSEPGRDADGRYQPVWFKLAVDDPEPAHRPGSAAIDARGHVALAKSAQRLL